MDEFNYNVPCITDFTDDCNNVDSYFDQMTEAVGQLNVSEKCDNDEIFYSPIPIPRSNSNSKPKSLRRSSSVGDLKKTSSDRVDVKRNNNLKRTLSKDSLYKKSHGKLNNGVQNKFVSMAEAINRFQKATPVRFRSKVQDVCKLKCPSKLTSTIPHSPALLTSKLRHRTNNVLSTEEKELLEFEEAQKFKIKAHPVNHRVLKGPIKPEACKVPVKARTVPEPFKLTAPSKTEKKPEPEVKKTEFHAKSVPKSLYIPTKLEKPPAAPTIPVTPTFMKNLPKANKMQRATSDQHISKPSTNLQTTKIEPFTFEHKYDIMKKKKDELIKKVFEEEKKAREFHARPMPKLYQKIRDSTMSTCSGQRNEDGLVEPHFKARPALVLKKEPFIPKKSERPLVEATDFHLNTDKRAFEREQFEKHLREKEEQLEQFKKEQEIKRQLEEMLERQRLRKEAEHVAQPIRKYKEVEIKPSNKVTKPISPKFLSGRRNKENEHTVI